MTTYGWTDRLGELTDLPGERLVLGFEAHGLSAGYRAVVAGAPGPATGAEWARRMARAPGVRADARAWYGLEEALAARGGARMPAEAVLPLLEAREFSLEVGWSEERPGTLLVTLPRNPASSADFASVHETEVRNVLLHVSFENLDGSEGTWLRVTEVQSDWNQQAAASGTDPDPLGRFEALEAARKASDERAEAAVEEALASPGLLAAATAAEPALTARPGAPDVLRRRLWQVFRRADDGEGPAIRSEGLDSGDTALLARVSEAFRLRREAHLAGANVPPVPPCPLRAGWPRLGLELALACAAGATDEQGFPLFSGVAIADGDAVAEASGADEAVVWAGWSTLADGRVVVGLRTSDVNGVGLDRTVFRGPREELTSSPQVPGLMREILARLERGEDCGDLDGDWLVENLPDDGPDVTWRNLALRRLYDSHLPRELAKAALAVHAEPDGARAMLTDPACATLARRFGRMPERPAMAEAPGILL